MMARCKHCDTISQHILCTINIGDLDPKWMCVECGGMQDEERKPKMTKKYYRLWMKSPNGTMIPAGAYGFDEGDAVLELAKRFPLVHEMITSPEGEEKIVLCGAYAPTFVDAGWKLCGHCGQSKEDHPIMSGTKEGDSCIAWRQSPHTPELGWA